MRRTGVAAAIISLLPHRWVSFFVDLEPWGARGHSNAAEILRNFGRRAVSAYMLLTPGLREFPWIGLQLENGRLLEGMLHGCTLAEDDVDQRDVALRRPIRITPPGEEPRDLPVLDIVIIPARTVTHITVIHAPERKK